VSHLERQQRVIISNQKVDDFTMMPSVYGQKEKRFSNSGIQVVIGDGNDHHRAISKEIKRMMKAERAIIVFFRDEESLHRFSESIFVPDPCTKLEERLHESEKESIIKKAAMTRQVTLATAAFGRGCDFVCYDVRLEESGGMHVLQTFVSMDISEEEQIKGRTARQGKQGSYGMILSAEDLQQDFSMSNDEIITLALKGDKDVEKYCEIRRLCSEKIADKFRKMDADLAKVKKQHDDTHQYLDYLLAGRKTRAGKAFKVVYEGFMEKAKLVVKPCGPCHYILCMDDSGSMEGAPFALATQAAKNFVASASKLNRGNGSAVSLIIFNDDARTACQQLPLDSHSTPYSLAKTMTFRGGGTSFDPPLYLAARMVMETIDQYAFHRVLLYTDGQAAYPGSAVQELLAASQSKEPGGFEFWAILQDTSDALIRVCMDLHPSDGESHCRTEVSPEQLSSQMEEVLNSMAAGFVPLG